MDLQDRIVLVTGASRRVGGAIANALAHRGAHVVISYRTSSRDAVRMVRTLRAGGSRAMAIRADLTRGKDVQRLMERITRVYGRLDVLVNSAATFDRAPFKTLTERSWD